ncbi:MAG: ribonuclease R [Proteobacteria bacterium]|nr:ribonuclease R [Pseudomonadota bacterium]
MLDALKDSEPAPTWKDLKTRFDDHRRLRLVLKGLERTGEIQRDHQGRYHRVGESNVEGFLTGRPNALFLNDLPVPEGGQFVLRAGDRVRGRSDGDQVQVLEVVEPAAAPIIGLLDTSRRYPFVEALSPDYKGRISLTDLPADARHGDTVKVRIIGNERRGLLGSVIEVLTEDTVVEQACTTLLEAHQVPRIWPEGLDAVVARLPDEVRPAAHTKRVDYRDCPLVTIDGETARDFDDAVFAEASKTGFRLVVAIADVAHYVKPGSLLDQEAATRGNSVYLPDRVIPMLPEVLSNNLCSLRPDEPRLAMVCEMQVSSAGVLVSYDFHEALIQSQRRLTYTQVGALLEKRKPTDELNLTEPVLASLMCLHKLYKVLVKARNKRGGLDFDAHESLLELEGGRVKAIHPVQRNDAHRLIEEAMILANVAAASFLEDHDRLGMYRVHEGPEGEKLEMLTGALALAGIHLGRGKVTPERLQQALEGLKGQDRRWLFESLILRSLKQAVYSPQNGGHFGLALERYMHFTSPIRRYADLLVHRAIKAAIAGKKNPVNLETMIALGAQISRTERRAEEVGWAVDGWLKADFLKDRVGETFAGVITGVTDFGLFVELEGCYVQGLLHISGLGQDYYNYQPMAMSLVGERSGKSFTLGQTLKVRLMEVRPAQGKLDLELIGVSGKPASNKGSGRRPERGRSKRGRSAR